MLSTKYEGGYTNITQITEALETSTAGHSVTHYRQLFQTAILKDIQSARSRYDRQKTRDHLVAYCQALGHLCETAPSYIQDEAAQALVDFDAWYTNLKSQNVAFQGLMVHGRDGRTSLTRFRTVLIDEAGRETNFYTTGSDNVVTKALKAALRKARSTQIYQENKDNVAFIIEDIIARRRHNRAWQATKKLPIIAAHFVMAFAFPVNILAVAAKATFTFLGKIGATLGAKIGFGSGGATTSLGIGAWVNQKKLSWKARMQRWFGKSPESSLSARVQAARAQAAQAQKARERIAAREIRIIQDLATLTTNRRFPGKFPDTKKLYRAYRNAVSTTRIEDIEEVAKAICQAKGLNLRYSAAIIDFITHAQYQKSNNPDWHHKQDPLLKSLSLKVRFIDGVNPGHEASYDQRTPDAVFGNYKTPEDRIRAQRGPVKSIVEITPNQIGKFCVTTSMREAMAYRQQREAAPRTFATSPTATYS